MKLSVRKKVANGLVLFLVAPQVVSKTHEFKNNIEDGLAAFSAPDDFDLTLDDAIQLASNDGYSTEEDPSGGDPSGGDPSGGDPSGGDPSGGDPSGGDPSGGDPSGGDPSGGDPSGGDPSGGDPSGGDPSGCTPTIQSPKIEISTKKRISAFSGEDSDFIKVSMSLESLSTRTIQFTSTGTENSAPLRCVMEPENNSCIAVEIFGPAHEPQNEISTYLFRVSNVLSTEFLQHKLLISPDDKLKVSQFAASLLSGNKLETKSRIQSGNLQFSNLKIPASDILIVSVGFEHAVGSPWPQSVSAQFVSLAGRLPDNSQDINAV